MTPIDLTKTKQSRQIAELRNRLERSGWTILKEEEREFRGKPRWEVGDEIPNLIYSWSIQRDPEKPSLIIDFIAHWDYMSHETMVNDCEQCQVRGSSIELSFGKDRGLKVERVREEWAKTLNTFMNELDQL